MRKRVGIIKRVSCIGLVFLLSINSFAAIVSDNDGAAFITKAEFDALKNDFQNQIDSYNTSIDSKIDGAIASYLAGISLATQFEWTLDTDSICFDKVKWKNLRFSSKYGEGALTVPQQNFLLGDEECYNGMTWDEGLPAASTNAGKVSIGGFDLEYKPVYDQGYLEKNTLLLDSWGDWKPHFLGNCTAYYKNTHTSDDSGSNPEWYGFMKAASSSASTTLTGDEWKIKPKILGDYVTRWTMKTTSNTKWERGTYYDEFDSIEKDIIVYPLSTQTNYFRNYTGTKVSTIDGFAHKLTGKVTTTNQQGISSYPWTTSTADFTNLDLGTSNPPDRKMTPYLNRLQLTGKTGAYDYTWMNVKYKNWTKDNMRGSDTWITNYYHGGPFTEMGWLHFNMSNDMFSQIKSKNLKIKTNTNVGETVGQGFAMWKNTNGNGSLKVTINMSAAGHIILYTGTAPDVKWGGTSNTLGGRAQDYAETDTWITGSQWKNNTANTISASTDKTFTITSVKKDDVLFFTFLPDSSTTTAKINKFVVNLTIDK